MNAVLAYMSSDASASLAGLKASSTAPRLRRVVFDIFFELNRLMPELLKHFLKVAVRHDCSPIVIP